MVPVTWPPSRLLGGGGLGGLDSAAACPLCTAAWSCPPVLVEDPQFLLEALPQDAARQPQPGVPARAWLGSCPFKPSWSLVLSLHREINSGGPELNRNCF